MPDGDDPAGGETAGADKAICPPLFIIQYKRMAFFGLFSKNARENLDKGVSKTRQSFFEGIKFARPGYRISDIGAAIQEYVEANGYSVVREYVGHGVGMSMHEEPEVPNYGRPGHGVRLIPGMTIAVEPMVNLGGAAIRVLDDGWTVVTEDGKPSAHYENTILITRGDPEILTPIQGDGGDGF